jgi:hypothetical protein
MSRSYSKKQKTAFYYCILATRKLFALCVIFILLLVPIAPTFADDEPTEASSPDPDAEMTTDTNAEPAEVPEEPEEMEEVIETESAILDEAVDSDVSDEPVTENDGADVSADAEVDTAEDLLETETTEQTGTSSADDDLDHDVEVSTSTKDGSEEQSGATSTAISAETGTSTEIEGDSSSLAEGDRGGSQDGATELASTTEIFEEHTSETTDDTQITPPAVEENAASEETPAETPSPEQSSSINDSNRFQFGVDECISMGSGSYYCADAETARPSASQGEVYAQLDSEGDREIYINDENGQIQITDNSTDDDAPFYDPVSKTIVWHRLVDGRYQLFEYDIEEAVEEQLTAERHNNMHPSRHGEVTVWQGWVGNDWEILLDQSGEFTMLTDNDLHDIAPYIHGDYIIWQSFEDNAWKVKVYNMLTEVIDTIEDANGGSVKNPRFVLVYDTKFDNGDTETKGYDLKSGSIVPLSSTPAPTPQELPDPDPVEEERALLQSINQAKPKTGEGIDIEDDQDTESDIGENTATSTFDVVVPALATTSSDETLNTEHIPDVVVEADSETSSTIDTISKPPPIDDLIIAPFENQESVSGDSQDAVASGT